MVGPDGHVSIPWTSGWLFIRGSCRVTAAGQAVGTPAYMSPEQAQGENVDHRTDLWSLGVVLFEMLTGELPFGSQGGASMFRAILSAPPPPLDAQRGGIPPELQSIVEIALAKQPDRRWQSAREMARQLESVPRQSAESIGPDARTHTIGVQARPVSSTPSGRENKRTAWYATGILVVVAAGMYPLLNAPPPHVEGTAQTGVVKQVAVLPFEVIGGSPDARTTSDGLVEILTTTLSELEQFRERFVAVPASEIRRRSIMSVAEAKRVYGVGLAITGSVQPAGDKLLFTVNLIDTVTGFQVDGAHFEYDAKHPIDSRNSAIEGMARLLKVGSPSMAKRGYTAGDSQDPEAYAAYLLGLGFIARYDVRGNVDNAIASFQSATRQDPTFGLAYARLAASYWRKAKANNDVRTAELATENAKKAVALNPKLATVHAVLGSIYAASGHQKDAISELRKALDMDPSDADAQRELARLYENLGRTAEAETAYKQSTKMRPTDWYAHVLLANFYRARSVIPKQSTRTNGHGN